MKKENTFPRNKYTSFEIKHLLSEIRKNHRVSDRYPIDRLNEIINDEIIKIRSPSNSFMISVEGVRLSFKVYSDYTELVDQLIDIAKNNDNSSKIHAIKMLGIIDEAKIRVQTIKKAYLAQDSQREEIETLINKIFYSNTKETEVILYQNLHENSPNTLDINQINDIYFQAKHHAAELGTILLNKAMTNSNNQVYNSKIKIYSMISFLVIFFLFAILPVLILLIKMGESFSLIQNYITQLSKNNLNIKINTEQSTYSSELESIMDSISILKEIQIDKYNLENKNHQLISQLQQASTTDFLTNISNRRSFLDKITHSAEVNLSHSYLAIIDIDNFKLINDKYGHSGGDEVLIKFALLLKTFFRKNDLYCRYGGEEFAILLHDCDKTQAKQILDRLCKKARYLSVELPTKEKVYFTISIGGTKLVDISDINAAIIRADKALYHSKSTGKNRVTLQN